MAYYLLEQLPKKNGFLDWKMLLDRIISENYFTKEVPITIDDILRIVRKEYARKALNYSKHKQKARRIIKKDFPNMENVS